MRTRIHLIGRLGTASCPADLLFFSAAKTEALFRNDFLRYSPLARIFQASPTCRVLSQPDNPTLLGLCSSFPPAYYAAPFNQMMWTPIITCIVLNPYVLH